MLEIAVKPAKAIEGRFLDRATRKGIPHLEFSVVSLVGDTPNFNERHDGHSNEKGEFRVYVKAPGTFRLSLGSYGNRASHLSPQPGTSEDRVISRIQVLGEVSKLPDLELAPAGTVSGSIEEKERKNQNAAYEIFTDSLSRTDQSKTKETGKFTVFDLTPNYHEAIYIRHGNAVNIPESKKLEQYPSPSPFVISESHAVRVSGLVLDNRANPVSNAQVSFYLKDRDRRSGSGLEGKYLGTRFTAPDGKFELGALWPNVEYELVVYCAGFEPYRQFDHFLKGVPGQLIKNVKITLVKKEAKHRCRGKLVGANGKPIEDGVLAAAGRSWLAKDVRSEKDGSFEIDCISPGPVFLVASHKEFRHAFIVADTGEANVSIVMHRLTDQPRGKPVLSMEVLEARKKMAAEITDRYWEMELNANQRRMLLRTMELVDRDRARKFVEKLSEKDKKDPLMGLEFKNARERILQLAREDADLAIAESERMPMWRQAVLCQVADTLLGEKKVEISRKFAGEVAQSARKSGMELGPFGGLELAKAGELAWRSGDKENGEKWIKEGAELVVKNEGRTSYKNLFYDLASSMSVLGWDDFKSQLKNCPNEIRFNNAMCGYLVKRLDNKNEDIRDKITYIKKKDEESYAKTILVLAKKSASKDLTMALDLAKELDSTRFYCQALMEIGLEIHRKDPQAAYRLVDRAFDFLEASGKYSIFERSFPLGGRPVLGAQMVFFANQMGYPHVPSLVARALGCLKDYDMERTEEWNYVAKRFALVLAISDPVTARQIVERFLPKEDFLTNWFNRNRLDGYLFSLLEPEKTRLEFTEKMGEKWTMDRLNHAGMLDWTRAFQNPDHLMKGLCEGLGESTPMMWLPIEQD